MLGPTNQTWKSMFSMLSYLVWTYSTSIIIIKYGKVVLQELLKFTYVHALCLRKEHPLVVDHSQVCWDTLHLISNYGCTSNKVRTAESLAREARRHDKLSQELLTHLKSSSVQHCPKHSQSCMNFLIFFHIWSKFQKVHAIPTPPRTDFQNFNQEIPDFEILETHTLQFEILKLRFGPQFTVQTIKFLYKISLRTPGFSLSSPGISGSSPGGTFSPGGFWIFEKPGFLLQDTRIPLQIARISVFSPGLPVF